MRAAPEAAARCQGRGSVQEKGFAIIIKDHQQNRPRTRVPVSSSSGRRAASVTFLWHCIRLSDWFKVHTYLSEQVVFTRRHKPVAAVFTQMWSGLLHRVNIMDCWWYFSIPIPWHGQGQYSWWFWLHLMNRNTKWPVTSCDMLMISKSVPYYPSLKKKDQSGSLHRPHGRWPTAPSAGGVML